MGWYGSGFGLTACTALISGVVFEGHALINQVALADLKQCAIILNNARFPKVVTN